MKTTVTNPVDESAVPFLRGILIRSLLDSGLEFEEALELATEVRNDFSGTDIVTTDELREAVAAKLQKTGQADAVEAYEANALVAPAHIEVISLSGHSSAFSRGRHARYLQSSGMKAEKAENTTQMIYNHLLAAGVDTITTCELGYLTYLCLRQEVSNKAARRYLVWSDFQRSARPLLLLICGTVGSGKSTIASELAHLLEIVRTQSTDMLREVMRMMISRRLLPVLHESSFNAWMALPYREDEVSDREELVAEGYRSQAGLLTVPCEAVLQRAMEESVPLILEGVHAHPDLLNLVDEDSDAIVVHVTLAVLKPKELKRRLRGRGAEVPQRRAKRYLNRLESIWALQSYLLSEADRCDVPIINNKDKEKAVVQVIQQVNYELARHYKSKPGAVFGEVVERWDDGDSGRSWQEHLSKAVNT